jgi:hypothetical protein
MAIDTAGQLKEIAARVGIPFIYKSLTIKRTVAQPKPLEALAWKRACDFG